MRLSADLIFNSPTAQSTTILPLYITFLHSCAIHHFNYHYGLQNNYGSDFYNDATVQRTTQTRAARPAPGSEPRLCTTPAHLRLPPRYTETAALSPTLGMTGPPTTPDDAGAILASRRYHGHAPPAVSRGRAPGPREPGTASDVPSPLDRVVPSVRTPYTVRPPPRQRPEDVWLGVRTSSIVDLDKRKRDLPSTRILQGGRGELGNKRRAGGVGSGGSNLLSRPEGSKLAKRRGLCGYKRIVGLVWRWLGSAGAITILGWCVDSVRVVPMGPRRRGSGVGGRCRSGGMSRGRVDRPG